MRRQDKYSAAAGLQGKARESVRNGKGSKGRGKDGKGREGHGKGMERAGHGKGGTVKKGMTLGIQMLHSMAYHVLQDKTVVKIQKSKKQGKGGGR